MHVEYAQHPPPEDSADRIFISDNAVIVLDGATAFAPAEVGAQTYADQLGRRLLDQLIVDPEVNLSEALSTAIEQITEDLNLRRSEAPSSTVAVLRQRPGLYDVLVLGDSVVHWGAAGTSHQMRDDRLARVGAGYREEYRARLTEGHGYDDEHSRILQALQAEQRKRRNCRDGYWIAEANPEAAYHAVTTSVPQNQLDWAILATDGASNLLEHLSGDAWPIVAKYSSERLAQLLAELWSWENRYDSDGQQLPRAKRHDDKTVCCVTWSST